MRQEGANGSGLSEVAATGETTGTDADGGREWVGADACESQSSETEGKGLLAKGGIGCSEVEKSKGAGWVLGLSSNHTSLYS